MCEISDYILTGMFFFFKLQCFVAKSAAELAEEKGSITAIADELLSRNKIFSCTIA